MLDFLLVLGQVPGTNIQITFNELLLAFSVFSVVYEYRFRRLAIRRWCKWAWYRLGVNYRRRKRMLRTFIRTKRYRLAVFERRIIRQTKSFLRRQRHALYIVFFYRPYSRLKRQYYIKLVQVERLERRAKRTRAFQAFLNLKDSVNHSI
jgi:hypothetical protein